MVPNMRENTSMARSTEGVNSLGQTMQPTRDSSWKITSRAEALMYGATNAHMLATGHKIKCTAGVFSLGQVSFQEVFCFKRDIFVYLE
jgi:hypothetical protein